MESIEWIKVIADLQIVSARFELTIEYLQKEYPDRLEHIQKCVDSKQKIDDSIIKINQIERLYNTVEKEYFQLNGERLALKNRIKQLEEFNELLLENAEV